MLLLKNYTTNPVLIPLDPHPKFHNFSGRIVQSRVQFKKKNQLEKKFMLIGRRGKKFHHPANDLWSGKTPPPSSSVIYQCLYFV